MSSIRFYDSNGLTGPDQFDMWEDHWSVTIDPFTVPPGAIGIQEIDFKVADPSDSNYVFLGYIGLVAGTPDSTVSDGFTFDSNTPPPWADYWGVYRLTVQYEVDFLEEWSGAGDAAGSHPNAYIFSNDYNDLWDLGFEVTTDPLSADDWWVYIEPPPDYSLFVGTYSQPKNPNIPMGGANGSMTTLGIPSQSQLFATPPMLVDDVAVLVMVMAGEEYGGNYPTPITLDIVDDYNTWQMYANIIENPEQGVQVWWTRSTVDAPQGYNIRIETNTDNDAGMIISKAFRGAIRTGVPFDDIATSTGGPSQSGSAPGITTPVNNCQVAHIVVSHGAIAESVNDWDSRFASPGSLWVTQDVSGEGYKSPVSLASVTRSQAVAGFMSAWSHSANPTSAGKTWPYMGITFSVLPETENIRSSSCDIRIRLDGVIVNETNVNVSGFVTITSDINGVYDPTQPQEVTIEVLPTAGETDPGIGITNVHVYDYSIGDDVADGLSSPGRRWIDFPGEPWGGSGSAWQGDRLFLLNDEPSYQWDHDGMTLRYMDGSDLGGVLTYYLNASLPAVAVNHDCWEDEILADNPERFWFAPESGGTLTDLSGNGHHAIPTSITNVNVDAPCDACTADRWAYNMGQFYSDDFPADAWEMSFETMFRMNEDSGYAVLFHEFNLVGSNLLGLTAEFSGGTGYFTGPSTLYGPGFSTTYLRKGCWYHVVLLTSMHYRGQGVVFLNGAYLGFVAGRSFSHPLDPSWPQEFWSGSGVLSADFDIVGTAIYNHPLSVTKIRRHALHGCRCGGRMPPLRIGQRSDEHGRIPIHSRSVQSSRVRIGGSNSIR